MCKKKKEMCVEKKKISHIMKLKTLCVKCLKKKKNGFKINQIVSHQSKVENMK